MKQFFRKSLAIMTAAALALPLAACSNEVSETDFEDPLPWQDALSLAPRGSYERLDYSVTVFNTEKGVTDEKRFKIADGTVTLTLNEKTSDITEVSTDFSVTYGSDAPDADKNKTDKITSSAGFNTKGLTVLNSYRKVELAERENTANLSYTITADYNERKASYSSADGKKKSLKLPASACRDNEMMFYIARAQKMGKGTSATFFMINLFDSFQNNGIVKYQMTTSSSSNLSNIDVGDWVKEYGVEAVETDGATSYPVPCYCASLTIYSEKHGPAYTVYYSENPFVSGNKSHKKIPVRIEYSVYTNTSPYRLYRYDLKSCDFDKPAEQ